MEKRVTVVDGVDVARNLQLVRDKISTATASSTSAPADAVQLVAVSKTKPIEYVQAAYHCGQRVFGENYAQELVDKAQAMSTFVHEQSATATDEDTDNDYVDPQTASSAGIQWHFIGGLQSNKANMLVKGVVPYGQLVVETVNSAKVARKLYNAMEAFVGEDESSSTTVDQSSSSSQKSSPNRLGVYVQVNTSGEDSKSGVATPQETEDLCRLIHTELGDRLSLLGLMTIGAPGDEGCLEDLASLRDDLLPKIDNLTTLGLSMGMSADYEVAIAKGATNVRVGSTIFGVRDYS